MAISRVHAKRRAVLARRLERDRQKHTPGGPAAFDLKFRCKRKRIKLERKLFFMKVR